MKLTAKVKLQPDADQWRYLLETLEKANTACDTISQRAWDEKTFGAFGLQKLVYREVRDTFDLAAQMVVRLCSKVADAYKLDRRTKRTFRRRGAIAYDDRILKWYTDKRRVSIWSIAGRLNMPYVAGERQYDLLRWQKGEADLVYHAGAFYILATCDIPDPTEAETEGALGVDMGVVNIASTSDGDTHTSEAIERNRQRISRQRGELQRKGTRSAKRRLKKLAGRQRRFQADVNHCIAKQIVNTAKDTGRGIALENLKGISFRVTVRRSQRTILKNWAFNDLQQKIKYKAQLAGIPVVLVDPRNSSRTCPACGHVDKANRKTQDKFLCTQCACAGHADYFASVEISRRAAVNPPNAVYDLGENPATTASLRL